MAKRPTIALCLIAKNEENNLPILLESVKGCFDEIHLTDTGSTDKTVEIAKELGCQVHHFEWVDDFSSARNASFSHAQTDYIMWLDLDDKLMNKEEFIQWRDHAMRFCDFWYATYDYASDDQGTPVVSFVRERVIKKDTNAKWHYFIHEGLIPPPESAGKLKYQYATTWKVHHRRTMADIEKDKGRNLGIFERNGIDKLDSRMLFYYGKELFENKKPMEGFKYLLDAASREDLALHDRILALQFACYSAVECNQIERAVQLAHQGLQLAPNRAEFLVVIADAYVKQNKLTEAIPYYAAAKSCPQGGMSGDKYAGAVFNYKPVYTIHPRINLVKCYFHLGDFERAHKEALECQELFHDEESKVALIEIEKALEATKVGGTTEDTPDIIITTPAINAYPWDSELYKTRHMGGSETAAIEVASWLRKKTNRPVKVFNHRENIYIDEDGVEYHPIKNILDYTRHKKPYRHIAWRHNSKLTEAPTFLWCHDLTTQHCEIVQNFDKMLCLSEFHKNYVSSMQGISKDKILLWRNGLRPERFKNRNAVIKQYAKVMFPSSPDRGLIETMQIMDLVVKEIPEAELHVFYGIERLDQYGMRDLRIQLEQMFKERPWVKYHGGVDQQTLANHFMSAEVWLYAASFIESFAITAIEALASHCYPIVRDLGALPDTLKPALDRDMAECLDLDTFEPANQEIWAQHVISAIKESKWKKMDFAPEQFSWESATEDFIKFAEVTNI